MNSLSIQKFNGEALSLRGNEIDTDRIIPARFLKCVVFEGLENNVFIDDRNQLKAQGLVHPFDKQEFSKASILLVNKNFGCGSSREHAPQAIKRWGINIIIGESYSEIFFGNNVALGVPCLVATKEGIEKLMSYNESNPKANLNVDLNELKVYNDDICISVILAEEVRQQFLQGTWDTTAELLEAGDQIDTTALGLPYFH